jgi:hypothetical protein
VLVEAFRKRFILELSEMRERVLLYDHEVWTAVNAGRSFRRCTAFLAVALALAAVHPRISLGGPQTAGTITAVRGPVWLKTPGEARERLAARGDDITPGDVVSTGKAALVQVALFDDSLITLAQESSVRVNQFSFDPKMDRRTAVIRVLGGAIRLVVSKVRSPESDLTIQSDTALITVDNLGDCIVATGNGSTKVIVLDQSVRVKNAEPYIVGELRLNENQQVIVRKMKPPESSSTVTSMERTERLRDFTLR